MNGFWTLVAAVLLGGVVLFLIGYYSFVRIRARRAKLSLELDTAADLVEDRSYNQLRLARTEADALEGRGVDVRGPRALLESATAAQSKRDFDHALALARSAHESLVKLQQGATPLPAGPGPRPVAAAPSAQAGPAVAAAPGAPAEIPVRPAIPKNKAESRFQLSLLDDELGRPDPAPADPAAIPEARGIQAKAQAAFDQGDFTEAMRLALRARRRLGARLETLPATSAAAGAGAAASAPLTETEGGDEEPLACRSCGEALRSTDRFCRYCGTLRGPDRCPDCGTPLLATDRFCGGCGRTVGAAAP